MSIFKQVTCVTYRIIRLHSEPAGRQNSKELTFLTLPSVGKIKNRLVIGKVISNVSITSSCYTCRNMSSVCCSSCTGFIFPTGTSVLIEL